MLVHRCLWSLLFLLSFIYFPKLVFGEIQALVNPINSLPEEHRNRTYWKKPWTYESMRIHHA